MGRHLSRKLQRLTAGKKTNLRSLRHERCEDQILHSGINAPIRFQMHIGFLRMILARPKSSTLATSVYRCVCPRCRGAIAGGGERPKLEGSYQRCSEPAWHRPGSGPSRCQASTLSSASFTRLAQLTARLHSPCQGNRWASRGQALLVRAARNHASLFSPCFGHADPVRSA